MKKKTARIGIRVKPQDKKHWEEAADIAGLSLSTWITYHLNAMGCAEKILDGWESNEIIKRYNDV